MPEVVEEAVGVLEEVRGLIREEEANFILAQATPKCTMIPKHSDPMCSAHLLLTLTFQEGLLGPLILLVNLQRLLFTTIIITIGMGTTEVPLRKK